MRKLALSMLIAAALTPVLVPAPALAACLPSGAGCGSGSAGDLIRRIERDLDRLTRGLESDVKYIEKKRKLAKPTAASPQFMQR